MARRPDGPFSWGALTPDFLDDLAARLAGLRVLETFAGNGLLAAGLAARGVDVLATSLLTGHDGHAHGMHHPVEVLDAVSAVRRHGGGRDVLLMCWPPADDAAVMAALEWGDGRPVVFVGEVTDLAKGFFGGCASDLFFEVTEAGDGIQAYEGRSRHDRAGFRSVLPGPAARWAAGVRIPEEIRDGPGTPAPGGP